MTGRGVGGSSVIGVGGSSVIGVSGSHVLYAHMQQHISNAPKNIDGTTIITACESILLHRI